MATYDELLGEELASWPGAAGVAAVAAGGVLGRAGDTTSRRPWASVTKVVTALTVLRAVEDGRVALDEPAGPEGSTVRHLLAHASGVGFDDDRVLAAPGRRRIYSNRGIELVAEHTARRAGRPFPELMADAVLDPLGMAATALEGSPASGVRGPVEDLALLARELLAPRGLATELVASATGTTLPGLAGVLPGFGRQQPNDWGLGIEVRGAKEPHWTSPANSPATFGHFGQSGSFLWVDPEAGLGCVSAGDTAFGPWAAERWPVLSGRLLEHHRTASPDRTRRSL
jgi:CubicO group peptidase (beta-lactamase class C family)